MNESARIIDDMPADVYHSRDDIGSTMLKEFDRDRQAFYQTYIAKTAPPPTFGRAVAIGDIFHVRLLEPERYQRCIAPPYPALGPDGKKWRRVKGSEHEAAWNEEVRKREGLIATTQEEFDTIEAMAHAVAKHEDAARLLYGEWGHAERSIFWSDYAHDLPLKCRFDWWTEKAFVDIKTTRDPSPGAFAKQAANLGYHISRALYVAGTNAIDAEPRPFFHIAVGNAAPHNVAVYLLDDRNDDGDSVGYAAFRRILRELAECRESDDWRNDYEKGLQTLNLPRWALTERAAG